MTTRDGIDDFKELDVLAKAGQFEKALEKHLWFHEASRDMPGMGGVRLSYALELWFELAEKYSPALAALMNLRNSNREILLKGEGGFDNFHDLAAINETLEDTEDTYTLFLEMHDSYPKQAKRYYHVVENLLVGKKAYDMCAYYIIDPIDKYKKIERMHKMNVELTKKNSAMDNNDFNLYTKESYVSEVCQLIEIMVGVSKNDTAEIIKETALRYFDDDRIRSAICA